MYHLEFMLDEFTPIAMFEKLKSLLDERVAFLFESVVTSSDGNFSYIILGARERIWQNEEQAFFQDEHGKVKELESDAFSYLKSYYQTIDQASHLAFSKEIDVGFTDGFIGFIGYDMVKSFEPVLKPFMKDLHEDFQAPDLDLIRPKLIVAYSHKSSKLTLVSSLKKIANRFEQIQEALQGSYEYTPLVRATLEGEASFSMSEERFKEVVDEAKEYIRSGDIFQIVLSNRLTQKCQMDAFSFYRKLRSSNPSPYLFFMEYENFCIAGSSPEVMVRLSDERILLRPIAGTRKRGNSVKRDKELEVEMLNDPKERAEHIMLVDLGRNDVGRVAKAGTVEVTDLMRVERYSHVMHIVSDVEATIDERYDMFDLFKATFTAGTMSGSPKIRAMELIAQFEGLKRGFYSGSIGYFGFDGNMDSAITIRTARIDDEKIVLQAGAGVVADSVPELEFLEVNNKLGALNHTIKKLSQI